MIEDRLPATRARPLGETRARLGQWRRAGRSFYHPWILARTARAGCVHVYDLRRQGARAGSGGGINQQTEVRWGPLSQPIPPCWSRSSMWLIGPAAAIGGPIVLHCEISYSATSSARSRIDCGTERPSAVTSQALRFRASGHGAIVVFEIAPGEGAGRVTLTSTLTGRAGFRWASTRPTVWLYHRPLPVAEGMPRALSAVAMPL
jgi:hypothetical protein